MKKNFSHLSFWSHRSLSWYAEFVEVLPKGVAIGSIVFAFLLAACGDTVENTTVNQLGMEVVASEDDLPECTEDNEGELAFVKDEDATRICVDGKWKTSENGSADFSCTTKELKDKSGVKIICNGDSIGVVLNGSDGKDGEKGDSGETGKKGEKGDEGAGCTVTQNDTAVTITCGEKSTTIDLANIAKPDSAKLDSEAIAVSLDPLAGYSQKGPFLKGSTVYLYELEDGRTLKQTNGNFTSNITRDDGYYKFNSRDLVSQYALIVVDGHYRNEVTGNVSNTTIRLKAISDVHKHSAGANVNILTHLEYERVYYLVTKKKMKVSAAKRQAQREILGLFGIEIDNDTDAEEMDIFGKTDADAALLALSILLQGDRSEAEMMALLAGISNEIAVEGKWNSEYADTVRAQLADWAFGQKLSKFRKNVKSWNIGDGNNVPEFEKYIFSFIAKTYKIDTCKAESTDEQRITNPLSIFYGRSYQCYKVSDEGVPEYVTWVEVRSNDEYLNPDISYKHMIDWRDRRMYRITRPLSMTPDQMRPWLAENLDFDYRVGGKTYGSRCYDDSCRSDIPYGRHYTWAAAMDSAGIYSADGVGCGYGRICNAGTRVRGICPEGWHLPNAKELERLIVAGEGFSTEGKGKAGATYKSRNGWGDDKCLDQDGFSAVPSGYMFEDGMIIAGRTAFFWSSSELDSENAYRAGVIIDSDDMIYDSVEKAKGMSIRCIQD